MRKGVVANLEFRPTNDLRFYWRNIYNRYEDTELQPEIVYDYRDGDLEDQTPTSGTFTEGEGERINRDRYEVQEILSSTLGGEVRVDDWTFGVSLTYGESEQDTPYDNAYVFESTKRCRCRTTRRTSSGTSARARSSTIPTTSNSARAARGGQLIEEDLLIQADVQRDFFWGDNRLLQVRREVVSRENTSDQDMIVYDGFDGDDDFLLTQVAADGDPDFFSDVAAATRSVPTPTTISPTSSSGTTRRSSRSATPTRDESFGVDYQVKEDSRRATSWGRSTSAP